MHPPNGHEGLWQLIDQSVVGIFRSTVEGKFVIANTALAHMFGYESPEELLESITDIASQIYVDSQRRKEFCRSFQEGATVSRFVSQAYRKHHGLLWMEDMLENVVMLRGILWGMKGWFWISRTSGRTGFPLGKLRKHGNTVTACPRGNYANIGIETGCVRN